MLQGGYQCDWQNIVVGVALTPPDFLPIKMKTCKDRAKTAGGRKVFVTNYRLSPFLPTHIIGGGKSVIENHSVFPAKQNYTYILQPLEGNLKA